MLMVPSLLVFFIGALVPWIWFALVHFSHKGRCVVTNQRVFIIDCPGLSNNWYALWHISAVDTGGWPFNTAHIHTADGGKISVRYLGNQHTFAQAVRHAKAL